MLCFGGKSHVSATNRSEYMEEKGFHVLEMSLSLAEGSLGLPRALGSNPVELSVVYARD